MRPRKEGQWSFRYFIALTVLLPMLLACGSETSPFETQSGETDSLQRELASVLTNTNYALINGATETQELSVASCKPNIGVILVGVSLTFPENDDCNLDGTIKVKVLPASAKVDLAVVGLDHVSGLNFDADIDLAKSGSSIELGFEILGGQISLGESGFLGIKDLVLSGEASFLTDPDNLKLVTRMNAFDAQSKSGFAFITNILSNKQTGDSSKDIRACFLSGGDANDPNAGTVTQCFSLGN